MGGRASGHPGKSVQARRGRGGEGRGGFSLVELLVVITLIAILAGIILPVLGASREAGRRSVCLSNLHQLGVASTAYVNDDNGYFWRYYSTVSGGRLWWFGYEANGPGTGTNRPLDKTRSALAYYLAAQTDPFECPDFPYGDPGFFPKFAQHSASYGYNMTLGPTTAQPTAQINQFTGREGQVFLFADGIQFDTNPVFNEGHYIEYTPGALAKSGYAHFRHIGVAQMVMMDGHAEGQPLRGPAFSIIVANSLSGNLTAADGSNKVYGF